jgi:hypothetical protein
MTEAQLVKTQRLSQRIHRLRSLLGDHENVPQLIKRPKHANRAAFRKRKDQLRKLEIQLRNLLDEIKNVPGHSAAS